VVFGVILPTGAPRYGLLLLSGLLAFNLFSVGLTAATTSITANGPLVQKVWFPREILPLAAIGANLITFCFQLTILMVGLAAFRQVPEWGMLWLTVPALLVTLTLATGLGLMLAALNVYYRDVQHFLELGLLTWFWLTPIVYLYDFVAQRLTETWGASAERLAMLNPMVPVVTTFQRVVYNPTNFGPDDQENFEFLFRPTSWYLENLAIAGAMSLVLLYTGFRIFTRLEANLGEQL
jgi:ABC-2 type transport system permease protein